MNTAAEPDACRRLGSVTWLLRPEESIMALLDQTDTGARPLTVRSVRTFFIATFAISWGLGVVAVLFPDQLEALFGPMGYTNPFFIVMVYSPGIVGVVMVWHHTRRIRWRRRRQNGG